MSTTRVQIRLQRYGIGVLRIVLGTIFAAHGFQKFLQFGLEGTAGSFAQFGLPLPTLSAGLVMTAELVGGLALAFGFLTRVAALPLVATMAVAMLVVHLPNGFFLPQGIEFTLALLAGTVTLLVGGSGAWAVDNVLWRSRDPVVTWALARVRPESEELRRAA